MRLLFQLPGGRVAVLHPACSGGPADEGERGGGGRGGNHGKSRVRPPVRPPPLLLLPPLLCVDDLVDGRCRRRGRTYAAARRWSAAL